MPKYQKESKVEISRVEFFCLDKKVGEVLRLLTGIALEVPKVTPVTNAVPTKNGLKQQHGSTMEAFVKYLKKKKLQEVTAVNGKELMKELGMRERNYSNLFRHAAEQGILRKRGSGLKTRWMVA
jgi:hypothetical protein